MLTLIETVQGWFARRAPRQARLSAMAAALLLAGCVSVGPD